MEEGRSTSLSLVAVWSLGFGTKGSAGRDWRREVFVATGLQRRGRVESSASL